MEPYIYQPLDRPGEQVRLLHLLPGDEDDDIRCTISIHDLDSQCPVYSAISYTWGDARPTRNIVVDGLRFKVGQNCWYALWQMRYHKLWNTFWIDAICIDQQDNSEKGAQVPLMWKIFHNAECVSACVGPGDELLRRDFHALAMKPYFSRLWIKQEVLLAKTVLLFCGLEYTDFQDLEGLKPDDSTYSNASSYATPRNRSDMETLLYDRLDGTYTRKPISETAQDGLQYLDLLVKYGDALCQDPRDKLYGLLSLVWPSDPPILVSYSATLADIGSSVVRWLRSAWDDYIQQPKYKNYFYLEMIPPVISLLRNSFGVIGHLIDAPMLLNGIEDSHLITSSKNNTVTPFYWLYSTEIISTISTYGSSNTNFNITSICSIDIFIRFMSKTNKSASLPRLNWDMKTFTGLDWEDCQVVTTRDYKGTCFTMLVNSHVCPGDIVCCFNRTYEPHELEVNSHTFLFFIARNDLVIPKRAKLISYAIDISELPIYELEDPFFPDREWPWRNDYCKLEKHIFQQELRKLFSPKSYPVHSTFGNRMSLSVEENFVLIANSSNLIELVKRGFSSPKCDSWVEFGDRDDPFRRRKVRE